MVSSLDRGKWAVVWSRGLLHDTIATEPRRVHDVRERIVYFEDGKHPRTLFQSKVIAVFDSADAANDAIQKGLNVWSDQTAMVTDRERQLDEARNDRVINVVRIITDREF